MKAYFPGNELHFHLEEDECNLLASCCIVAMKFFSDYRSEIDGECVCCDMLS